MFTASINIARVSGEYDAMNFVENDIIMDWSFKITSSFEGKTLNLKMLDDTSLVCREKNQENEPLSSFCEQCKVCICNKCGQTRHSHHTKVDIDQAAKEQTKSQHRRDCKTNEERNCRFSVLRRKNKRIVEEKQREDCNSSQEGIYISRITRTTLEGA